MKHTLKHSTSTSINPDAANVHPPEVKGQYEYIRQKELIKKIPFSPATLWRKVKAGTFVKPVKLSDRITAWKRADVDQWLRGREASV